MDIRSPRALKEHAQRALLRGREPKKVITVYASVLALTAAILAVVNFWLDEQMAGAGGLSNIGTRSILSTVQTVLPLAQQLFMLAMSFGYVYALLRIARGQYADHTDLKMGFRKLAPILRLTVLQGLIYMGIAVAVFYLAMQVFLLTSWSTPLMELLTPLVSSGELVLDDAIVMEAGRLLIPMYIIFALLYFAVITPLLYRLRMASYALMDDPHAGAFAALRASRKMMRGHCLHLLKVDLSFWWFYLLDVLVTLLCYLDLLLPLVGIQLPFNATVSFFLFYAVYLAAMFAINYFLRNRVELTYIMAYEAIHERPRDSGIVLGNIFDL